MVAGIAMFIFAITGENEIDMSPSKSPTGLSIESIVFASVVNEDLTFEAKPDKHFLSIQPVYILIKPKGYASSVSGSKYSLDIVEGLFVRDPNGRLLDYLSKKNLLTIKESDAKDIAIKNMLKFNDDAESGEYEITVDLIDRRTGQSTTMTETMTIEKAVFG